MDTIKTAAAAVIGARHARAARNGQDACAVWRSDDAAQSEVTQLDDAVVSRGDAVVSRGDAVVSGGDTKRLSELTPSPAAVVVVCDGCSAGDASEVGARLGARLFANAVGARLLRGASPADAAMWADARAEVVASMRVLAHELVGSTDDESGAADVDAVVRAHFLFTIVAAAVSGDDAAVWALGDGAYVLGDTTRELGPFADNAPPYLAYDLLGDAPVAHFEVVPRGTRTIIIATDGASDLLATSPNALVRFGATRFLDHPDALRRELAVLARGQERIDWDERRVVRTPAVLQDDCAVAVVRWEVVS